MSQESLIHLQDAIDITRDASRIDWLKQYGWTVKDGLWSNADHEVFDVTIESAEAIEKREYSAWAESRGLDG